MRDLRAHPAPRDRGLRQSPSICSLSGQAAVVSTRVKRHAPPSTARSSIMPSVTRSRCRSGSCTVRKGPSDGRRSVTRTCAWLPAGPYGHASPRGRCMRHRGRRARAAAWGTAFVVGERVRLAAHGGSQRSPARAASVSLRSCSLRTTPCPARDPWTPLSTTAPAAPHEPPLRTRRAVDPGRGHALQSVRARIASCVRPGRSTATAHDVARRGAARVAEALALGVREFYFTGGEPFLHPELLEILADTLAVAPCTVLTNGTLFTAARRRAPCAASATPRYSLEIRVSLDGARPPRCTTASAARHASRARSRAARARARRPAADRDGDAARDERGPARVPRACRRAAARGAGSRVRGSSCCRCSGSGARRAHRAATTPTETLAGLRPERSTRRGCQCALVPRGHEPRRVRLPAAGGRARRAHGRHARRGAAAVRARARRLLHVLRDRHDVRQLSERRAARGVRRRLQQPPARSTRCSPTSTRAAPTAMWCLGDLGGFGPHPDRAAARLRASAGAGRCAATTTTRSATSAPTARAATPTRDDRHFAQISYDYTLARTSPQAPRVDARPARAATARDRRPPRAALPRLAAARERVPVGVHLLGRVPRVAVRRTHDADVIAVHAHRAPLAPRAPLRPPRGQRRAPSAAPPTTARPKVWYAVVEIGEDVARRLPARRLRPRSARARDGVRGPARRVRRDHPHRLVDDLPREPAHQRTPQRPPLENAESRAQHLASTMERPEPPSLWVGSGRPNGRPPPVRLGLAEPGWRSETESSERSRDAKRACRWRPAVRSPAGHCRGGRPFVSRRPCQRRPGVPKGSPAFSESRYRASTSLRVNVSPPARMRTK